MPVKHHIIIDTDPGIDDALAMLLAMSSPEIDILGVTTVAGNKPVDVTTNNALSIAALSPHHHVDVYRGCPHPLTTKAVPDHDFHGADGLGDIELQRSPRTVGDKHAVDFLVDTVMAHPPDTVTLCAIAPLTNIATACRKSPRFAQRLGAIYIMGGGRTLDAAEFNFRVDPDAAAIVLASGAGIRLIGLDVTRQVTIARDLHRALMVDDSAAIAALRNMLAFCMTKDAALHDVCVIAALIEPALFDFANASIGVECRDSDGLGHCAVNLASSSNDTQIAVGVDVQSIADLLVTRLGRDAKSD